MFSPGKKNSVSLSFRQIASIDVPSWEFVYNGGRDWRGFKHLPPVVISLGVFFSNSPTKRGGGRNPAPGTNGLADLACMWEYVNIPLLNLLEQSCWLFASLSD